jgi:hypothetical protein
MMVATRGSTSVGSCVLGHLAEAATREVVVALLNLEHVIVT